MSALTLRTYTPFDATLGDEYICSVMRVLISLARTRLSELAMTKSSVYIFEAIERTSGWGMRTKRKAPGVSLA